MSLLYQIPIILLVCVTFWLVGGRTMRSHLNRSRARRELPGYAGKIGLKFEPPEEPGNIGRLHGTHMDHAVEITPDEYGKIEVKLRHEYPSFHLSAGWFGATRVVVDVLLRLGLMDRSGAYTTDFSFEDATLDRLFNRRVADPEVAAMIGGSMVREALQAYLAKWQPKLDMLTVSSTGIGCTPRIGRDNRIQSITPEQIEAWLPDLIELADSIENALASARRQES